MSDDPEFSGRDFLYGLGAAAAANTTPTDVIKTVTKVVEEGLHPLAREIATDVLAPERIFLGSRSARRSYSTPD